MKQKLLNKLWLRVGMIVAIMTTALAGTAWAQTTDPTVTYNVATTTSVTTSGTAPTGSSATYLSTYGTKFQLTKNNSATLTLSGYEGYRITNITLLMRSNASGGAGTLYYSTDGGSTKTYIVGSSNENVNFNDPRWNNAYSTDYVEISKNVDITATSSDLKIVIAASANSLYCMSYKLTYVAAPTYTIEALSNNENYGTVSLSGSVITATPATGYTYADPAYTVNPANSATVSQNGDEFTVTPSANTTVTINFEALPTYTVTLSDDTENPLTETLGGAGVNLPSRSDVGSYTFAGWSETNVTTETTEAPTIIPAGTYHPTGNITLYPVYTKAGGGAAAPSAFSVGDTGDYAIVSAEQDGKYYALPTNPTVSNGKITAQEITVNEANGVKYVTTANAGGFTWTIAAATNGYTLSDGNNYIYHSNGGASGTNLTYGNSTNFTWAFTADGNYVTMAAMNGSTTNNRGMLFQGTTIGGYALSNATTSGYYKVMILPISAGSTTYYWSSPVAAAVEQPVIAVANTFLFSTTVTITCDTEDASIKYSFDGETWNDYSAAFTITETKTIYAKAIKDNNESTVASVTATKELAIPTVTVSGDLTVDLAGETNVNAGTLTASVAYNNAAVAGATVTWTSSDTDVATIDASTGVVTLLTPGEVTFTATYAGDSNDYASATGTKTITVVDDDPSDKTLWSEDFGDSYATNTSTYSYVLVNGDSNTKTYNENLAGGNSPELLVGKNGGSFAATIPLNNNQGNLTLTFKTNAKAITVSSSTAGISISGDSSFSSAGQHTVTFTGVTTTMSSITIVFAAGTDNVRLDDILLKGAQVVDNRMDIATIGELSPTTLNIGDTDDFTLPITFASDDPTDYEVTWTSSNPAILELADADETYEALAKGVVTVTVTVEPVDDVTYKTVSKSFEVTVVDPNAGDGTLAKPYSVAEAIENTPSSGNVYISGIVSSFYNTSIVGDGSNYRYYISDDGTTTTQLLVYKGKGLNQETFANADDLLVGDEVVIYGTLITYQNAPEVASGNYLYNWNRPASTEPSITITPNVANLDADDVEGTLAIAYANLTISDMTDFDIQYYNAEGEEANKPVWVDEVLVAEQDPQVGEGYVVSYTVDENNTGAARTAYFKVYAMDDESNLVYSNLVTITQAAYTAPASVTFDFATNSFNLPEGSTNKATDSANFSDGTYSITLGATTGYYWHTDGYVLLGKANSTLTLPAFPFNVSKISITGTSGASEAVVQNIFVDDDEVSTETTGAKNVTNEYEIAAGKQAAGTIYTLKVTSGHNTQISKIEVFGYEPVEVTSAGYATYCSEYALDFKATGISAYVGEIDGTALTFSPRTQVPANTGLLLVADGGSVNVPIIASADAVQNNCLIGTVTGTTLTADDYILNVKDGKAGFYRAGTHTALAAHRAYIPYRTGVKSFAINLDDDPTAITEFSENVESAEAIYNVAGQRVGKMQKGIYIVNGKKILK